MMILFKKFCSLFNRKLFWILHMYVHNGTCIYFIVLCHLMQLKGVIIVIIHFSFLA